MDPAFVAAALKDGCDAGILLELGGGSIALTIFTERDE